MAHVQDLIFCTRDAEALARLLANHPGARGLEAEASEALGELLSEARFVPDDELPAECVALGSRVVYADGNRGARRTVTLVSPEAADPAEGRISVFSPIGLALIGRRSGAASEACLPNGRRLRLRVLEAATAVEADA